jgi:hypothetical protein
MPVNRAPTILSVTLSPAYVTVGVPMAVVVSWTGFPEQGVNYQWRRGSTPIRGAIRSVYTPDGSYTDLNCLITIDNGIGSAISASLYPTAAPAPDVDEDDGGAFSGDFSSDFG